ncbi:MAG: 30S ribosomal protein S4 [Desulfurococcales archaeon]|nr:30S ribosomal protein S4 [Desulfurococcales archaeon]
MGDPRKPRKKWEGPKHPWIKDRLMKEVELVGKYGLKNKRELWIAETLARKLRHRARNLLALPEAEREHAMRVLLEKLYHMGLVEKDSTLDDILGLTAENILERRLQTIVFKKGLAKSIYHARQLIVHGHIAIQGRRVTSPGYLVSREEEDLVDYAPGSPYRKLQEAESSS